MQMVREIATCFYYYWSRDSFSSEERTVPRTAAEVIVFPKGTSMFRTCKFLGCGVLVLLGVLVGACKRTATENQTPKVDPDIVMLKQLAPVMCATTWRSGEVIGALNHLRHLGKERSLAVLRQYLDEVYDFDERIYFISLLLFPNANRGDHLDTVLGAPRPPVHHDAAKQFPLFPVALSNRVPFLLIEGWELEGVAPPIRFLLAHCEKFSLVDEGYPETGYEESAKALTESALFRALHDEKELPGMTKIVLDQATAMYEEPDPAWQDKTKWPAYQRSRP